ncbi:MAG: hypothetical protein ABSB41_17050 [Anaerolineales bacterium]|jgi:hypothetical protein
MFKTAFFFLTLLILTGCAGQIRPAPQTTAPSVDLEEQAVFAALIQQKYGASKSLVIRDTTATDAEGVGNTESALQYVLKNTHGLEADTLDNFRARNVSATPVAADMNLGVSYVLLRQSDLDQIFAQNQDGWQVFYERFPDAPGIFSLSRVGFNAHFDQALVYLGIQSQYLNGSGHYFLLEKVKGTWTIDQVVQTWIS